jgi:hypothetical protein
MIGLTVFLTVKLYDRSHQTGTGTKFPITPFLPSLALPPLTNPMINGHHGTLRSSKPKRHNHPAWSAKKKPKTNQHVCVCECSEAF